MPFAIEVVEEADEEETLVLLEFFKKSCKIELLDKTLLEIFQSIQWDFSSLCWFYKSNLEVFGKYGDNSHFWVEKMFTKTIKTRNLAEHSILTSEDAISQIENILSFLKQFTNYERFPFIKEEHSFYME
jgi:hypothetical protein